MEISRSSGALSLDFAVQIVIILVVVSAVITAFVSYLPRDTSEIGGQELAKRGQIETECRNRCNEIKTASTEREKLEKTVDYCTAKFRSDLDQNSRLTKEGAGYNTYCEDGIRCFHMHECDTGSGKLTARRCVEKLCEYYTEKEGLDALDATDQIDRLYIKKDQEGIYGIGSCDLEGTDTDNWYKELQTLKEKNEAAGGMAESGRFCQN